VASLPQHLTAVVGARPELMFINADDPKALAAALAQADVVAIGPGLGTDAWAQSLLQAVLSQSQPAQQWVLDADALNLLAAMSAPVARDNWILTPHPGEAARLLGITTAAVQADRLTAVGALQQRWGGVVVLKGAGTLIGAAGQVTSLCDRGNPGMAIPGMGDVLTGAVAGILAQCRQPLLAAKAAVLAHAMAGDLCAADGERGLLAGDIALALHAVVNP
jgi:NAD(P)H-hydrate epimerase